MSVKITDLGQAALPLVGTEQLELAVSLTESRRVAVSDLVGSALGLDSSFVTLSANPALPNERILTAGTNISIVDGGPGLPVTINALAPVADTLQEVLSVGNSSSIAINMLNPAAIQWNATDFLVVEPTVITGTIMVQLDFEDGSEGGTVTANAGSAGAVTFAGPGGETITAASAFNSNFGGSLLGAGGAGRHMAVADGVPANPFGIETHDYTVHMRYTPLESSGSNEIVGPYAAGTLADFTFFLSGARRLGLNIGGVPKALGSTILALSTTYHIAFTKKGNILRLFLNGNLEDTVDLTGTIWPGLTADELRFGTFHSMNVDNIVVIQDQALWDAPFSPPATVTSDTFTVGDPLFDTVIDGSSITLNVSEVFTLGSIFADEKAAASGDIVGKGQFWVRNDAPNVPMFTDDDGTDFVLNATGTGDVTKVGVPVNNQIGVWTGDGTIEGDANLTFDGAALLAFEVGASFVRSEIASSAGSVRVQAANGAGLSTGFYIENSDDAAGGGAMVLDNATGRLSLQQTSDNGDVLEDLWVNCNRNQGVGLYHNNIQKLQTVVNGVNMLDSVYVLEKAAASADFATFGQFWVRNDVPNTPMFTDDAGTDFVLNATGGDVTKVGIPLNDQIGIWTGDGTIEGDANLTWSGTVLRMFSVQPRFILTDTDAAVDEKNWLLRTNGGTLGLFTATDAAPTAVVNSSLNISRTGTAINNINLNGGQLIFNCAVARDLIIQENGVTRLQVDNFSSRFVFNDYSVFLEERAAAGTNLAAYGQVWVLNTAPNQLYFTDDAAEDFPVAYAKGRQLNNSASNFNTAGNYAANWIGYYDDGTNNTITTENSASQVNWPIGTSIQVVAPGSGVQTIAEGVGVTIFFDDGVDSVGGFTLSQGVITIFRATASDYIAWGSGITP